MSFCPKCGAYIPMEETACPACGYDPEAEKKKAAEEAARAEAERRKAEEERKTAEEAARRAEEQRRTRESAERVKQQAKEWAERARQEFHNTSGTQSGTWTPPWSSGSAAQTQSAPTGSYQASSQSGSGTQSGSYTQTTGSYTQRTDSYTSRQNIRRSSRLSLLSYFGILFLIPLILHNDDPFARFHANQGLVLFLFEAAVNIAAGLIPLGGLVRLAGGIVTVLCMIRGVRSVLAGRMDKLPVIGDFRLIR